MNPWLIYTLGIATGIVLIGLIFAVIHYLANHSPFVDLSENGEDE